MKILLPFLIFKVLICWQLVGFDHDSNQTQIASTCTSKGQEVFTVVQNWTPASSCLSNEKSLQSPESAPLLGPSVDCSYSHDVGFLEMCELHEDLWENTPVLWSVRKIMAHLCRSNFPATTRTTSRPKDARDDETHWPPLHGPQSQWTASPKRKASPRRRTSRRGRKSNQEVCAGKGKAKGHGPETTMEPPALASLPTDPPWTKSASPSGPVAASPQPPQEDKQLKAIMSALKKHSDTLPPELQTMVNEAAIKEGQQQTKHLHAVVAVHGKARKGLQQAQLARFNLHTAWRGFLSQAVTLWEGYSRQFREQEQQLNERVEAAQASLDQAKENLATTKSQAGVDTKEDSMQVSEDDNDKDVAGKTSARIKEGLSNLHSAQVLSGSVCGRGAEGHQATSPRPSSTRAHAFITWSRIAWFWLGRENTIDVSIALGPYVHPWDVPPLVPKWLHTVVHEHDFVSEWAAIGQAHSLAISVNACPMVPTASVWHKHAPQRKMHQQIRFASDVHLILGFDDNCGFFEFAMPMESLADPEKPWGAILKFDPSSHGNVGNQFDLTCQCL